MERAVPQGRRRHVAEVRVDLLALVSCLAVRIDVQIRLHALPMAVVLVHLLGLLVTERSEVDAVARGAIERRLEELDVVFVGGAPQEQALANLFKKLARLAVCEDADLLVGHVLDGVKLPRGGDDVADLIVANVDLARVELAGAFDRLARLDLADNAVDEGRRVRISCFLKI